MPTYEYACADCGHELEAVQSFTDDPLTECPECAGTLRKRFGNVGVVFKGSGFYRTDSKADAKPAAKADAKPDAKPAPKAEPKAGPKAESPAAAKPAPAAG